MRNILLALLVLATPAFAAAPDPLLQQIVAAARAAPPASIAFERSSRAVSQDAGGAAETHTRVERWDGQQITPLSIDGKPATPDDIARIRKAAAGKPVAGYHRIADYFGNGAKRSTDAQGHVVFRVDGLPKGSVDINGDRSSDMAAEALVDTSGPTPFVSRLRVFLIKPLSFFMVAKLDSFEVINDYKLGATGRPALIHQIQTMAGAQMGKAGTTRTEISYTPLR